jgi:hypothetical protein
VEYPYSLDHSPVLFQLDYGYKPVDYPYKLNPALMKEVSFDALVWDVWNNKDIFEVVGAQHVLTIKLKNRKHWVKEWTKIRKANELFSLENIEAEIIDLNIHSIDLDYAIDSDPCLKTLELERNKMLLADEERWHQKSWATWIKCGDKNSKFFHRFASFRRNKKHPWEVMDEMEWVHKGHEAIKAETLRYFSSFYKEVEHNIYEDQIVAVLLYPRIVTEEDVITLENLCIVEEVS